LNTMPTDEKTLRNPPAQAGHSVSDASNRWLQAVQAY